MNTIKFAALVFLIGSGVTLMGLQQKNPKKMEPALSELGDIYGQRKALGDTRFTSIKVDKTVAHDEIDFWSRQLSEHALFLHLGIEDAPLKAKGLALHKEFEQFRALYKKNPDARAKSVFPVTKKLRAYKVEILTILNSGKWIGWIFPLFARHIILELDYFVDKLNNIKYTDKDEIAFWNVINGEHASFAAHLLDPSERDLFLKGDKLSQKFANVVTSEAHMMRKISLTAAKELDDYNKTAQKAQQKNELKSIIHPVLLDHVIREGQRSIRMLNSLHDKKGAIYPKDEMLK